MVQPENETENLLLSKTINRETLIKQTHTEQQLTLEFKLTKPGKTFSFKTPIILGLDSK